MSQNFNNNNNANEEPVKAVENTKVWSFNDFQVEFDVTDVDTADRYEKTFDIMGEKEKKLPLTGKKSEQLKAQFEWFSETFDRLFGEGASEKIFNGKRSVSLAFEAYESFLSFVASQKNDISNRGARISSAYSNRAQRRAAAKSKK